MSDQSRASMFDYDARPVTPQVVIVGLRASSVGYQLRDFLSRNGIPYEWVEIDDAERVRTLLDTRDVGPDRLPVCLLPDGTQLAPATVEGVATGLGLVLRPALAEYDLTIVGAGPAGLAAAVYAASEGLRAVAIEAVAPGGQAGTTSMIENYLGFPQGISGSELATRATAQARRFGAEVLLARPLVDISEDGPGYLARLSDGIEVRSRSVLVASGVDWRRLAVPGLDALLGAGVYYGAGPSEAVSCRGCRVAVIGGGNSAGQAVMRFSRYASRVTLLVRGRTLGASMSQYLATRVSSLENVDIRTGTEVIELEADTRLRAVLISSPGDPRQSVCRWSRSSSASAGSHEPTESRDSGLRPTRPATSGPGQMCGRIRAGRIDGRSRVRPCRSRPTDPGCSQPATFVAGRSNVVRRRSARDRWPSRWSTGVSPKSVTTDVTAPSAMGVPSEPHISGPSAEAVAEFAQLASDERLRAAVAALEGNGMTPLLVDSGEEARTAVRSVLPVGAEVYNNTSRTLEAIGVADDIERSGRYQPLRARLYQMDREMQAREMRRLGAASDFVVGSVHAATEQGSLLIASASGSQLGPLASGAGHVIVVIGGQKIVPDLATGLRRINEYCFPLEDRRAREAYGVPSGVNNVLIINRVIAPGRVTAILVRESIGF